MKPSSCWLGERGRRARFAGPGEFAPEAQRNFLNVFGVLDVFGEEGLDDFHALLRSSHGYLDEDSI